MVRFGLGRRQGRGVGGFVRLVARWLSPSRRHRASPAVASLPRPFASRKKACFVFLGSRVRGNDGACGNDEGACGNDEGACAGMTGDCALLLVAGHPPARCARVPLCFAKGVSGVLCFSLGSRVRGNDVGLAGTTGIARE